MQDAVSRINSVIVWRGLNCILGCLVGHWKHIHVRSESFWISSAILYVKRDYGCDVVSPVNPDIILRALGMRSNLFGVRFARGVHENWIVLGHEFR